MTSTKILPRDICSPIGQKNVFSKVVSSEDEGIVLAVLVNSSQRGGGQKWKYSNSFPKSYQLTLKRMDREGTISEMDGLYCPTPDTIDKLAQLYPNTN